MPKLELSFLIFAHHGLCTAFPVKALSITQSSSAPLIASSEEALSRAVSRAPSALLSGTSSFFTASTPTEERYSRLEFFRLSSAPKKLWNLHHALSNPIEIHHNGILTGHAVPPP